MAEATKKSYPMLPVGHWWTLRKRFKQSIPGVVTEGYLSTVLKMAAQSARANVLPFLKTLGIIDDEGKTTERAREWRDDSRYAGVCKEILKQVYPQELLDTVNDSSQVDEAQRWFARDAGVGEGAARRMATLYVLLLEADVSKTPDEKAERARPERKSPASASRPDFARREAAPREPAAPASAAPPPAIAPSHMSSPSHLPGININLEIHISADATSDQIDAIFASMAKHIYNKTA